MFSRGLRIGFSPFPSGFPLSARTVGSMRHPSIAVCGLLSIFNVKNGGHTRKILAKAAEIGVSKGLHHRFLRASINGYRVSRLAASDR
jgi:hypothetical protein